MKNIFALFVLAFLLASCKKDPPIIYKTYPIQIGYSSFVGPGARLIVTASNTGELLGDFDFQPDSSTFVGSLNVREDVVLDRIDIHIISPEFGTFQYDVRTHIGVPVGSYVHFFPNESYPRGEKIYLNISGVDNFDTLRAGNILPAKVQYNSSEKSVYAEINTRKDQGVVLRVKADNTGFKYYYLPDALQGDTLQLHWDDFKEEINMKQVGLPLNVISTGCLIDAVSPDFTKAISIFSASEMTITPTFNLPDIVPNDWLLRVRMSTSKGIYERVFGLQEPLVLDSPNFGLDELTATEHQISITTTGNPDFITVQGEGDFNWYINGSVESFKNLTIPDLSPYLAATMQQSSIDWKLVFIKQFNQHNADDIRKGLPYRSPGFFPVARSGYHEIMY